MVYNNNGYVMLHRKIFEWEWWDDINTFRLFVTILLMANWSPKKWRGRVIPRGSCWTSLPALALKSGLTYQQTRTSFDKLKSTGEITDEATSLGRLVTVANYDVYQINVETSTDEITDENAEDQQTSNERVNRRATTNKKYKEINNNNNIKQQQKNGRSTNEGIQETGIDLMELLTVEEISELGSRYEFVNDLLDEVEADINAKGKTVRYTFRYVDGYARNKGWPRKREA